MEYIWNGNPSVWKFRAPILFPIVGRLKDGYFLWQGKEYHLPNHGFSRDLEHSVVVREKERVVWRLQDTPYTRELFPDPLCWRPTISWWILPWCSVPRSPILASRNWPLVWEATLGWSILRMASARRTITSSSSWQASRIRFPVWWLPVRGDLYWARRVVKPMPLIRASSWKLLHIPILRRAKSRCRTVCLVEATFLRESRPSGWPWWRERLVVRFG